MSKAEDLLNSLSDEEIMLYSTTVGEEGHIIIGSDRTVTVPDELKKIAVQYDHNVETVTFDCPRYSDGVDMSEMAIYVNYMRPDGYKDAYSCKNVIIDETDPEIMHFDWTITRNATQVPGNLRFLVCVKKTDIEGNNVNHWNSDLCSDLRVGEGLECEEQIEQENPDAIISILTRINKLSEEKIDNPSTGSVGQFLEIESVDEKGKPKTYKAVDKPTVPEWAKSPQKPTYTASEVGADAAGTAESKVSEHNVSDTVHNDIRLLVQGLTERLNALADSDDTTLDQMSEVVAYIKSNKSLIDAITTSKINVSDIIDNLTTNVSNKPLSAAQGVKLKALIDAIPKTSTGMERIEKLSTDTAVELEPNKLYIFSEMSELAITLAEPSDTGIANEYHVVFQSGSTPTSLTIPSAIKLPSEFAVEANKVYRLSILEGCLKAYSWNNRGFTFHVKIDSSLDYPYLFSWETYKDDSGAIWGDNWPGEPMKENENGWFTRELPPQQHNGNLRCIVTCEAGNKKTLDIDVDGSKSDVWITVNASYEHMVYYEEPTI